MSRRADAPSPAPPPSFFFPQSGVRDSEPKGEKLSFDHLRLAIFIIAARIVVSDIGGGRANFRSTRGGSSPPGRLQRPCLRNAYVKLERSSFLRAALPCQLKKLQLPQTIYCAHYNLNRQLFAKHEFCLIVYASPVASGTQAIIFVTTFSPFGMNAFMPAFRPSNLLLMSIFSFCPQMGSSFDFRHRCGRGNMRKRGGIQKDRNPDPSN